VLETFDEEAQLVRAALFMQGFIQESGLSVFCTLASNSDAGNFARAATVVSGWREGAGVLHLRFERSPSMPESSRLTAHEIFEQVESNAHDEVRRTPHALAFSGLAGGITMGLTGLAVASAQAALPENTKEFIPYLFYPLGFIAVIIGRAQLFTENTLYPVALILSERKHVLDTAKLWAIVFVCNVIGASAFAALAVRTSSLKPEIADHLVKLGQHALDGSNAHIFWSGVIGGWLIALVAWMVSASTWTIGQIAVIWLLAFVVGIGHFSHCIATSGEILASVFAGQASLGSYFNWLLFATVGNILGGIFIVTLLNFGQVKAGEAS
jgi:formate/nitrite transporter FocA (FNT family)